ncbi:MAG TPA: GNAT family N-acetyltransferase [Nocardioidaceae bacterium]|nr:GNAT family N-acetyltransferase [Nocardioidaceae bacterium]
MGRPPVHIRAAVPADAAALIALWTASTEGLPARLVQPTLSEAERSIERQGLDPLECLQVAVVEDEVVGVAHFSRTPVSPLHEDDAVQVTHLFVAAGSRRRGVGRALLAAAAAWADDCGATHLLTAVAASSRDAARFLACLGLAQTATVRSVPVAVLRQRLTVSDAECVDTPARQARRRTLLRRQISARERQGARRSDEVQRPTPTPS